MTITSTPRWSLGRGNAVVPSRWQATIASPAQRRRDRAAVLHSCGASLTSGANLRHPGCGPGRAGGPTFDATP
jgi:hypothetical protein